MTAFRSSSRGRTTALRENASSSRVRSAARPAASSIDATSRSILRRRVVVEDEPAVAGDDREQIVEVVSDAAGEPADRVEALRLVRLLLGPQMRRAVDDRARRGAAARRPRRRPRRRCRRRPARRRVAP